MKIDEIIHYASKIKSGEFVGEQVIGAVICDLANYVRNQYPKEAIIRDVESALRLSDRELRVALDQIIGKLSHED